MTLIEVLKVQHNIILRQLEYLEKLKSSAQSTRILEIALRA